MPRIHQLATYHREERQLVLNIVLNDNMVAVFVNICHYCMAGHSTLAKMIKMDSDVIAARRAGTPVPNVNLEALHRFATLVLRERGFVLNDGIYLLWREVLGSKRGRNFFLTQRKIDAIEAMSLGVVNEVVSAGDLLIGTRTLAETIAKQPYLITKYTRIGLAQRLRHRSHCWTQEVRQ